MREDSAALDQQPGIYFSDAGWERGYVIATAAAQAAAGILLGRDAEQAILEFERLTGSPWLVIGASSLAGASHARRAADY